MIVYLTDNNDTLIVGQPVSGTDAASTILLADPSQNRLYSATWRGASTVIGQPGPALVEQFRIAGLGGSDHIEFVHTRTDVVINGQTRSLDPLVVSDLVARSKDWVGVIDGGDGDDTLIGTDARDRIDGGFGSDLIYGYGGDDQLWGDGGKTQGRASDRDVLFGGGGHDDMLGGQGQNVLIAWSQSPFGVSATNAALAANSHKLFDALVSLQNAKELSPPRRLVFTLIRPVTFMTPVEMPMVTVAWTAIQPSRLANWKTPGSIACWVVRTLICCTAVPA